MTQPSIKYQFKEGDTVFLGKEECVIKGLLGPYMGTTNTAEKYRTMPRYVVTSKNKPGYGTVNVWEDQIVLPKPPEQAYKPVSATSVETYMVNVSVRLDALVKELDRYKSIKKAIVLLNEEGYDVVERPKSM